MKDMRKKKTNTASVDAVKVTTVTLNDDEENLKS